jgi:hypothetical protein
MENRQFLAAAMHVMLCLGVLVLVGSANAPAQTSESLNLRIRDSVIDIAFERYAETVGINVLRRSGDVEILAIEIARLVGTRLAAPSARLRKRISKNRLGEMRILAPS